MARLDRAIHALLYLTMCSIILRLTPEGTYLAANRDELIRRAWDPPAPHWPDHPGIVAAMDAKLHLAEIDGLFARVFGV
jgi:uncharacterized protein with NRDE domain